MAPTFFHLRQTCDKVARRESSLPRQTKLANAADLIASRVTAHGAGFFIFFNQALDLPRLVYSTDLSSSGADLKILARMLNLNGAEGRNLMPVFTAANFEITTPASPAPEPSNFLMMTGAGVLGAC